MCRPVSGGQLEGDLGVWCPPACLQQGRTLASELQARTWCTRSPKRVFVPMVFSCYGLIRPPKPVLSAVLCWMLMWDSCGIFVVCGTGLPASALYR